MYLSEYTRNAHSADRARRRMQYRGETPKGDRLWTGAEDELCRQYGSNYEALRQKLPHRSYEAIRCRCRYLGLRPKLKMVTANELSRMRRLVPTASPQQLREAFPNRSLRQLRSVSRYHGITRKRPPFKRTGISAIDAIRDRCFELGYSMGDLDELAKTKGYFRKANWILRGKPNYRAIGRAVEALDGELTIRWREE
ncbi:hypothetical protein [Pseudaminobacter soli (ex Li et al. 2025)]|uniref:Uncharacterized protein n=1 Tax=Pseudaminobacter soli (ex Li et al. 2025) TaxID=1295366 RepID=A0A2P7RTZ3_9HYPH|nr:hypothetical protein [Mesorhizobium soli]PSJ53652.1 hypothetical protein C7I85_27915 [Mesorhizobium soli]